MFLKFRSIGSVLVLLTLNLHFGCSSGITIGSAKS